MTEPRWNLIRRIRKQIADGTYVNDAKLRVTADRLRTVLTGQSEYATVCPRQAPGEAMPDTSQSTEFHRAVQQLVLKYIEQAKGIGHLAVLAKSQVVAGRAIRRVITRGELTQRDPHAIPTDEVLELVMDEDAADEKEGTGR